MQAKALACERPTDARRQPLSRFSVFDVLQRLWKASVPMSYSTLWRLLHRDALRPWRQQAWLFPKDPLLLERAVPVLDLYHGRWDGQPLGPRDLVVCGDEMTGLQALAREHPGLAPQPGRDARREWEYARQGTLCYRAFLNVRTGRVYGETSSTSGIEPFQRAWRHCLAREEFAAAERIFLSVDNGSAHHPSTSPARLRQEDPRVTTVHLPVHSSWLNQIELYFSILQRKALTPRDFQNTDELATRLLGFQHHYNQHAQPCHWRFDRTQLEAYVQRLGKHRALYARHDLAAYAEAPLPPDCLTY